MIPEITPEELAARLTDEETTTGEDLRVVDIRSPAAFRRGHLPGSENVPFPELPTRVADLADADHVVTVCPHGKDSLRAGRLINSYEGIEDARVESLAGGLSAWEGELVTGESEGAESRGPDTDDGPAAPF